MKEKYIILLILFLFFISGCITKYEPDNVEAVSDLLIVDGTITTGETVVKLSRSVGLLDNIRDVEKILDAKVYIECSDGTTSDVAIMRNKGEYVIEVKELNSSLQYRLSFTIEGKQYQSSFLSPLKTPEIDSISWMKKGKGEPVYICVSTHGDQETSNYYRWSYKEHWETKVELFAELGWVEGPDGKKKLVSYDINSSNNTYYCWGKDSSKVLLLGATDKLAENRINQNKLIEISPKNNKLSVLYYVYIEQSSVRKEAYDYFLNMQKNIEQTGSIFSPVPSEMKGNIECVSDPLLPVIGYIDVSTMTRKEIYIPERTGLYEAPMPYCSELVTTDLDKFPDYIPYYFDVAERVMYYGPPACLDCRRGVVNKKRPSFWPNDHY